ncbi:MAG: hypothetical protein JXL84_21245 [Deltaproteobacteria bacterium]|nr:hypothetical protein [Deltaproteobacteria bacterium]
MGKELRQRRIRDLDRTIRDALGRVSSPEYTAEPGIAGIPTVLLYVKGELVEASIVDALGGTQDVTRNIKTILTVPLTLMPLKGEKTLPDLLRVWGIAYMEKEAFESLNLERVRTRQPPFAAMGDAVSTTLIHPDLRVSARQPLNMFCCGLSQEARAAEGLGITSHHDMMVTLQQWGLRVNRPHILICRGISEVITCMEHLAAESAGFPYEIDGALLQLNDLGCRSRLEEAASGPGWNVAFETEER